MGIILRVKLWSTREEHKSNNWNNFLKLKWFMPRLKTDYVLIFLIL